MSKTIVMEVELVAVTCCTCGAVYAMSHNFQADAKRHGTTFYCPMGHPQVYKITVDDELREAKKRINELSIDTTYWHNEAECNAKKLSSTRGQLTKTKNKLAKGLCPCCNLLFPDLKQHMENEHPGYLKEDQVEETKDLAQEQEAAND